MGNSLMPDWMKQAKQASDLQKAQDEASALRLLIADAKVKSEGPEFWKELKEKLTIQVSFLPEAFKINGSINIETSNNGEELCQVEVRLGETAAQSAYMNLYYRNGGSLIRCHPQFGQGGDVPILWNDKIVLLLNSKYRDADASASWILQALVGQLKPSAIGAIRES